MLFRRGSDDKKTIEDLREALAASRLYSSAQIDILEQQLAMQARVMNRCAKRLEDDGSIVAFDVALALREAARRYDR